MRCWLVSRLARSFVSLIHFGNIVLYSVYFFSLVVVLLLLQLEHFEFSKIGKKYNMLFLPFEFFFVCVCLCLFLKFSSYPSFKTKPKYSSNGTMF